MTRQRMISNIAKEFLWGTLVGLLMALIDYVIDHAVANKFSRRIFRYDAYYIIVLPCFASIRDSVRRDRGVPYTEEELKMHTRMDVFSYISSFFMAGMGLYLGYVIRSVALED